MNTKGPTMNEVLSAAKRLRANENAERVFGWTRQEIEFIDTKGTGPIDPVSKVKIRMAADKFYEFRFAMLQRQTKKAGGGWDRTDY